MTFKPITSSPFYSLAFDAALFDGGLRIYFAQYQEDEALKLYFYLKNSPHYHQFKKGYVDHKAIYYFLIYPTRELLEKITTPKKEEKIYFKQWNNSYITMFSGNFDKPTENLFRKFLLKNLSSKKLLLEDVLT